MQACQVTDRKHNRKSLSTDHGFWGIPFLFRRTGGVVNGAHEIIAGNMGHCQVRLAVV